MRDRRKLRNNCTSVKNRRNEVGTYSNSSPVVKPNLEPSSLARLGLISIEKKDSPLLLSLKCNQARVQGDISRCSGYTPAPHLSRSNRDSKAVTAPKCMITLAIVSEVKFYVALENPKKRISIQETVIHPKLWSFLRCMLVSFGTGMTAPCNPMSPKCLAKRI
jgi:hypothetical protein